MRAGKSISVAASGALLVLVITTLSAPFRGRAQDNPMPGIVGSWIITASDSTYNQGLRP